MIRTRTLVLSGFSTFALGWGVMYLCHKTLEENTTVIENTHTPLSRRGNSAHQRNSSRAKSSGETDFADYFMRIRNFRSSEECEACFEGLIKHTSLSPGERAMRMNMILNKWGEVAPRQAIEKVLDKDFANFHNQHKDSAAWVNCVFSAWTEKSPETAASYFKESTDPRIRKNPFIPYTIIDQWADASPMGAWDWLTSQDKKSILHHDQFKTLIINRISWLNKDKIPDFIAELGESDAKLYGPRLWESWFYKYPDSPEIMASLSEENKAAALLGSISGKTKGDLDAITRELSSYNQEEQQKLLFELAPDLISGDKAERDRRLRWLMANAPGALMQDSVQNSMLDWFLEKRTEAKEVLENLPPGNEKEALQKSFKSTPTLQHF